MPRPPRLHYLPTAESGSFLVFTSPYTEENTRKPITVGEYVESVPLTHCSTLSGKILNAEPARMSPPKKITATYPKRNRMYASSVAL